MRRSPQRTWTFDDACVFLETYILVSCALQSLRGAQPEGPYDQNPLFAIATALGLISSAASAQAPAGVTGSPSTPRAGPYFGLHGGYASDSNSTVGTTGQLPANMNNVTNLARRATVVLQREGYVAGGQVGYNVQRGIFVLGLEADASASDISDKATYHSPVTFGAAPAGTRSDASSRYTYLGSVRSRVGVATDRVMGYVTGGYGYGQVRDRAVYSNGALQRVDFATDHTYTLGGGRGRGVCDPGGPVARLGASRVTLRAEYLHYQLASKSLTVAAVAGMGAYNTTYDHQAYVVRGGLNFKF